MADEEFHGRTQAEIETEMRERARKYEVKPQIPGVPRQRKQSTIREQGMSLWDRALAQARQEGGSTSQIKDRARFLEKRWQREADEKRQEKQDQTQPNERNRGRGKKTRGRDRRR
jgi:hypothetical protein